MNGFVPALTLEVQRELRADRLQIRPGASVGVLRREEPGRTWHPWLGVSLDIGVDDGPLSLKVGHGWYRVTYVEREGRPSPQPPRVVSSVDEWAGSTSVMLVLVFRPL